jgi:hypothetical protein
MHPRQGDHASHFPLPALAARRIALLVFGVFLLAPSRPAAHEIPARVTVLAFVKPDGDRLRLVLRVPLEAMRDIDWPLHGPGYLDLQAAESLLHDAVRLWIVSSLELYEGGRRLDPAEIAAARLSLPSDRSFVSWDSALTHVQGPPLSPETEMVWQQALLDVLIAYPIASPTSAFSIRPGLAHLGMRTSTVLRFLTPDGAERVFQYVGDPGLVRLDPRWHQAALRFVALGFDHILDGLDHLLFILCLVIPFRRLRPLVVIVTAFTVAHSITLIASAAGLAPNALWFPPLVEALIALSIVFMAIENIIGARLERRWLFAFAFGLVHGFGFSFLLRESLQFAGAHLVTSLLAFNVGVELGQLLVVVLAIPVLSWLFRRHVDERMGIIVLSVIVAHSAWHWMTDRASVLREYQWQWPVLDLALVATMMRGLMLVLVILGVAWGLYGLYGRIVRAARGAEGPEGPYGPGGLGAGHSEPADLGRPAASSPPGPRDRRGRGTAAAARRFESACVERRKGPPALQSLTPSSSRASRSAATESAFPSPRRSRSSAQGSPAAAPAHPSPWADNRSP